MRLRFAFAFVLIALRCGAQIPDAPGAGDGPQAVQAAKPSTNTDVTVTGKDGPVRPEPKRILAIVPNYRAVSAGASVPPPSVGINLRIATEQALDYSAFVFGGIGSMISEARNAHPSFGKGVGGYGQYLWRGTVDRVDRSYQSNFLFPTLYREDPRYYAMEKGPRLKRLVYAATRVAITRSYSGHETFNAAGLSGKIGTAAVSTTYYPDRELNIGSIASRFGTACARDAASTVIREFYPDLRARFRHQSASN